MDLLKQEMTSELASSLLPSILIPLVGIMGPAVFIVLIGRYITATE
tara:strand:- start:1014 stop:1151 length:138 start_codon:yes stop_codon:yes gene_type:complete